MNPRPGKNHVFLQSAFLYGKLQLLFQLSATDQKQ